MANADAVRNQFAVWERLMHINVKAHTALRSLNQFPRGEESQKLLEQLDPETRYQHLQVRKNVFKLIEVLRNIEGKLVERSKKVEKKEEDDDEIVSSEDEADAEAEDNDSDEEEDNEEEEDEDVVEEKKKSSIKTNPTALNTLERSVQRESKAFKQNRNAILEKWFERTRLAVSKKAAKDNFDALETSAVHQIGKILSDRSRLVRRTQLKRVNTDRIAGPVDQQYDPEVFDDDDFYQTLLKEFIDQKSTQTLDPIQISRQWLEVQKLRQQRTKKRQVEKHATKGRKIRYVPIPKLANFCPAEPEKIKWSHERRNELFKSIFRY
ncbi:unnamed protein product [Bursaphelenchus okinawaensis]|uniref:Protein AATF n=1 Tax=Bursaphelenchus okinawaensis TaxID=465554 RepID=A0A811JQS6_9BILA|nr:unnamed protein product [Bursaphelenchus okinawaensis]CAG9079046.1 unnamed protein product [Bursaphelenchus okinawaensis]